MAGLIPPAQVSAADANLDKLCVPKYTDLGGDKWKTSAFEYEFISRFEIKVTYKETGNCKSPGSLDSKYLHENKLGFAKFVNASLWLGTMTNDDGAFTGERERVVYMVDGSSRSTKDETIIEVKHWESGSGINTQAEKETWDTYKYQSTSGINTMFDDSEYTIGIEEDLLNGAAACDGTDSNVHLVNKNDDGDGVKWICDNNSFNKRGANVLDTIKNKEFFNIGFKYEGDKIVALGTKKSEFTFQNCNGAWKNDSCNGTKSISISADQLNKLKNGTSWSKLSVKDNGSTAFDIGVAEAKNATVDSDKTASGVAGAANDQVGTDDDDSCEANGGALGWLLCPVLTLMDNVIEKLDGAIVQLLTVNNDYYTDPGIKDTAVRLRNVAYSILVPIMLVMVIGTALGYEVVSAYTVKKALPRLVIAVIFMALAYPICVFLIQLTNDVGGGVSNLITSLVSGASDLHFKDLFQPSSGNAALGAAGVVSGAGIALAFGSIGILFSYLFVALIAILIGFLLLSFRQFLIVGLLLLAPLAILSWIFPNHDKMWKLWWGTFSKLLLLFPLIMVMIAAGKSFAAVVEASSSKGTAATLIKIVAYVGPYFLIPTMFKFAGGLFATVSGMANDRGRGIFDRQKKYRGAKMSENFGKTRNYSRFSDKSALGRGLNTALGASFNPKDAVRGPAGIRAGRQTGRTNQGLDKFKNDATIAANQNDDNFLLALSSEELADQKLTKARQDYNTHQQAFLAAQAAGDNDKMLEAQAKMNSSEAEIKARENGINNARRVPGRGSNAVRLAALQALAKTGYQFEAGKAGYDELAGVAQSIAGGDTGAYSGIMNEAQYHLKNAQRFDLGGINNGAGYSVESGLNKAGLYQLANGKTDSIKAWGAEFADFNGPLAGDQMKGAAVQFKELEAMLPNATGGNRDEIVRQINKLKSRGVESFMNQGRVDPTGAPIMTTDRVGFNATLAQTDATYAGQFSDVEKRQGYREVVRQEREGEEAQRKARNYERPDPNRI